MDEYILVGLLLFDYYFIYNYEYLYFFEITMLVMVLFMSRPFIVVQRNNASSPAEPLKTACFINSTIFKKFSCTPFQSKRSQQQQTDKKFENSKRKHSSNTTTIIFS
jgi:hypothetical protein